MCNELPVRDVVRKLAVLHFLRFRQFKPTKVAIIAWYFTIILIFHTYFPRISNRIIEYVI